MLSCLHTSSTVKSKGRKPAGVSGASPAPWTSAPMCSFVVVVFAPDIFILSLIRPRHSRQIAFYDVVRRLRPPYLGKHGRRHEAHSRRTVSALLIRHLSHYHAGGFPKNRSFGSAVVCGLVTFTLVLDEGVRPFFSLIKTAFAFSETLPDE